MIARLTGTCVGYGPTHLILNVGGVGYKCFATISCIEKAQERAMHGEPTTLFTHLAVRETALDLFAFDEEEEVAFFELLIGISGIGPRSALAIMNMGDVKAIKSAAARGDTSYLTRVSGIGRKSAEKIVLELKDKLAHDTYEEGSLGTGDVEVLDALRAMGYTESEARQALKKLPEKLIDKRADTNARIKEALKQFGTRP